MERLRNERVKLIFQEMLAEELGGSKTILSEVEMTWKQFKTTLSKVAMCMLWNDGYSMMK